RAELSNAPSGSRRTGRRPTSSCPARSPGARGRTFLPSVRKRAYAGLAMTAERRRRVRFGLLLVLAVAVLVVVGGATAQPAVQSPLLLMISIDGLRPDHVDAGDTLRLELHNLPS